MAAVDQKRFKALGQDWVARFDFNSICEIEDRTGRPFLSVVAPFLSQIDLKDIDDPAKAAQAANQLRMSDLRMIMHQSLLSEQPDVTPQTTGQIISSIGMQETMAVIVWALQKGMAQEGGDKKNPPTRS